MAEYVQFHGGKVPIHRIALEGHGKPRKTTEPEVPNPTLHMETMPPFTRDELIKVRIGENEVVLPAKTLLKAVATLTKAE